MKRPAPVITMLPSVGSPPIAAAVHCATSIRDRTQPEAPPL